MKVAVASPPMPASIAAGIAWIEKAMIEAASAQIICFPESYLPGYPLEEFTIEVRSAEKMVAALETVRVLAAKYNMAVILPMDWYAEGRLMNVAFVISSSGEILGHQTKNQLDPSEDALWIPGDSRTIFEVGGVRFGITICHEGFRYPESVRWAAQQGAKIVFHPQCTGSNVSGPVLTEWGGAGNPYYEKAMLMRAMENTIFFASSNYAFRFPESASSIVAPDGQVVASQPYQKPGVFVADINPAEATGLLAKRFKNKLYYS